MHKIGGAHLKCVKYHNAKFEYCWSNRLHKPDTPYAFWMEKIVQQPSKIGKYLSNVHKIEGVHLQNMNNH